MPVTFRTYRNDTLYSADYYRLRKFLLQLDNHSCPFGRWDWMITHLNLDAYGLERIGFWEEAGELVAAVTYDTRLGKAIPLLKPRYRYLFKDMLTYASGALDKNGAFSMLILDGDTELQDVATECGYVPTQDKEEDAVMPIRSKALEYELPEGFSLVSFAERPDAYEFGRIMWKGFNHEVKGEGPYAPTEQELLERQASIDAAHVNPSLKIAAIAPDGHFASFCGMWFDPESPNALVEPVATDPDYRKMGLGKAVVLEAIRRCGQLGATHAFVGSAQQFYYQIGFRPFATSTYWAPQGK